MDNYRFHLEKYHRGSKIACPECKRKACFTRYIDESGEITFPPHVGKCDHENSCGYHYTPKDFFREHPDELDAFRQEWKPQAVTPKKPVSPPSFIDSAVMQRSLSHYDTHSCPTRLAEAIPKGSSNFTGSGLPGNGTVQQYSGRWIPTDRYTRVRLWDMMRRPGIGRKFHIRIYAGCIPSCVCPTSTCVSVSLANIFLSATPTRQFSSWKARRRHSSQPTSCRTACGWRPEERTAVSTKRPFVYWRIGMQY